MVTIKGKGVFGGIAIGKISFFIRESLQVKRTRVDDPDKEVERLYQARDKAVEELKLIYGKALVEVG